MQGQTIAWRSPFGKRFSLSGPIPISTVFPGATRRIDTVFAHDPMGPFRGFFDTKLCSRVRSVHLSLAQCMRGFFLGFLGFFSVLAEVLDATSVCLCPTKNSALPLTKWYLVSRIFVFFLPCNFTPFETLCCAWTMTHPGCIFLPLLHFLSSSFLRHLCSFEPWRQLLFSYLERLFCFPKG